MTNQNLFSGKIVIVNRSGTADYSTIGEAIQNAEPETRILVQPGVYRESIVIDRPLEILGDGQASRILIEAADASCIVMQTESSLVRGLTLRNINREKEHKHFAVKISQGKLVLSDCNITSDSHGGVLITGSTTNPEIRRCRIYDGKTSGIWITESGLGIIEDCDIYDNASSGVYINKSGNLRISRCRIYDGKTSGIYITENGLGIIEGCDIYGNAYSGVYVNNNSNPTVSTCRIYDCKYNGIQIRKNGLGIIEDCDIYRLAIVFTIISIFPIAFPGWMPVYRLVLSFATIPITYYQFFHRGFGQKFATDTIYLMTLFVMSISNAFTFNNIFWILPIIFQGICLAGYIWVSVFEQAKVMSNYDIKKLS